MNPDKVKPILGSTFKYFIQSFIFHKLSKNYQFKFALYAEIMALPEVQITLKVSKMAQKYSQSN